MNDNTDLLIVANTLKNYETRRIVEELKKENIEFNILSWEEISLPFNIKPKVCIFRSVPNFTKDFSVTYLLTFIEELERNGCISIPSSIDFYNSDKGTILLLARKEGILVPDFILSEDKHQCKEFIKKNPLTVYKPLIGSKGEGIELINNKNNKKIEEILNYNSILYVQEFIENKGYDIRTIFIDNEMFCQFIRVNEEDFRYNVSLGGKAFNIKEYQKNDEHLANFLKESIKIGEKLSKITNMKIFGIDTLPSKDNSLYFLEINPILGFEGAESSTGLNIAKKIVNLLIKLVKSS